MEFRKIKISRFTKDSEIFYIPLRETIVTLKGEGEYDCHNNKHGDVIINIEIRVVIVGPVPQQGDSRQNHAD